MILDVFSDHILANRHPDPCDPVVPIYFNDGWRLSVQASSAHLCRAADADAESASVVSALNAGPWVKFEIGYLRDNNNRPRFSRILGLSYDSYNGYVPLALLEKFAAKHGGVARAEWKRD